MRLRRDLLLFGLLAVAAVAGGWWLLSQRSGEYGQDGGAELRKAAPVSADTFRATVCGGRRCVLVEAGGMAFLFGAGEGAGDGLREMGLLRTDMDVVLLPELDLDAVAGLPGVAQAVRTAGRSQPLRVNGPPGLVAVVDGANLLASADAAVRLTAGPDGEDQGLAGRVVFDSGVVAIRMFASADQKGRAYRVDFEEKSLVLAGCRAGAETILAAVRGTKTVAGIMAAGSPDEGRCADVETILTAAAQGKLAAALLMPDSARVDRVLWKDQIGKASDANAKLGLAGAQIDLTGGQPQARE
jgi:hypothetical protein